MFENQLKYEPNQNKIDELANHAAYIGGLAIKNFVKVFFLHGRPNQPFASHGDHLPSQLEQNPTVDALKLERSDNIRAGYVPDPNPDADYYY